MAGSQRARLGSIPTARGGIARAAYARAADAGLDVKPLLKKAGLTHRQIKDCDYRITVRTQIDFLNRAAEALREEFFGFSLAERLELRELGLVYYVMASSATLGEALRSVARYSVIYNEGVEIRLHESDDVSLTFEYRGVARRDDRHQIEFFVATLVRLCRQLTGRRLSPSRIALLHRRTELPARIKAFFGCPVRFGSDIDGVVYPQFAKSMPVVNADPYLNALITKYCEEALAARRGRSTGWRHNAENVIATLLPHGSAELTNVAERLGISSRTLARRLASEGLSFAKILNQLRMDLAKRYLREADLPISEVAWLLGYHETSAFNHALKRWTGKTPTQVRSASRPARRVAAARRRQGHSDPARPHG